MAIIISNTRLSDDFYRLTIEGSYEGKMGQFYMLRGWRDYPVLSRPISIHNVEDKSISFLYKTVGEGTKRISRLKSGDRIELNGPYGKGFPEVHGKIALVGGGMGVAPLYQTAKTLQKNKKPTEVAIYMGFREKPILVDEYKAQADHLYVKVGGSILEELRVENYDFIFTCGPEKMMNQLVKMGKGTSTKVYVSIEKRMACGVGACLVCTCRTKDGNKKTCKDGPVFLGEEVLFDE